MQKKSSKLQKSNLFQSKLLQSRLLGLISSFLILAGALLLILILFPVGKEEIKYQINDLVGKKYSISPEEEGAQVLTPPNTDFSIVIPKIAAVAPVLPNIDPSDPKAYLLALKRGVAHAKGTTLPGEVGNVFLFAHSTDSFLNVNAFNAVFYLIGKLNPGDEVDIFYQGKLVKYQVYDKKVVDADSSFYFGTLEKGEKTLTLQTCYPPGTTLKRLVVLAKEVNTEN